jgi:hypothetical protein
MDRRRAQIAPSVLPADFATLGDECRALEKSGAHRIQWDGALYRHPDGLPTAVTELRECAEEARR